MPRHRFSTLPGLVLLLAVTASALGDPGLIAMDRTVREACACADRRDNGVDAAIQCSAPTRRYATQAVEYRDGWSAPQRQVEVRLRQVLEYCLTQARSYVQSLDELSLLPDGPGGGISAPSVLATWYRADVAALSAYEGELARVKTAAGDTVKGMVQAVSQGVVVLRLAPVDGGGERRLRMETITGVRILRYPRP